MCRLEEDFTQKTQIQQDELHQVTNDFEYAIQVSQRGHWTILRDMIIIPRKVFFLDEYRTEQNFFVINHTQFIVITQI